MAGIQRVQTLSKEERGTGMAEAQAGGVGARLRRHREERRISLRDIAVATKISPVFLESIERDEIKRLPGGIFTRAFVKAYAEHLGLDPDTTMREFVEQFPDAVAEHFPQPARPTEDEPRAALAARPVLQLGLIGLPLLLAVSWFTLARPSDSPRLNGDRVAAMRADLPAPEAIRPVVDVIHPSPSEAVPAVQHAGELTVVLTPTADCWVSASADGRSVVERLLGPGEQVILKASRSVVFKVGDASAVSLHVNGEIGRELGGPGEVVTTRIDRDNYREFLAAP